MMFDFIMDDESQTDYTAPSGPMIPDAMDCMRCGVCLSHCPTYVLSNDEQEGPRQRIRTLEQLLINKATVSDQSLTHLNNCVQCRACEANCPSQMDYGRLFDQAQHQLAEHHPKSILAKIALALIAHKHRRKWVLPMLKLYQISGLRKLAQRTGLLKLFKLDIADNLFCMPSLAEISHLHLAAGKSKGKIALFTGCISEHFDRETIDATIKTLTSIGYSVEVPTNQACCGAIHYHNGEAETAKQLMTQNRRCFNALDIDAIVYCATGCGAHLQEYEQMLSLVDEHAFQVRLYDVMDFVAQHWPDDVTLTPLPQKVSVHEACSQRNILKNQQATYQLLQKVPALQIEPLADNHLCCGAGGSYMLTHPDTAQQLKQKKHHHIHNSEADYIVSANYACALHLTCDSKKAPQVMHPISLIAQLL